MLANVQALAKLNSSTIAEGALLDNLREVFWLSNASQLENRTANALLGDVLREISSSPIV